jgi:hypothetical protein
VIAVALPRPKPGTAAMRLGVAAAASLAAAWVHQNHDPGALCPLRRLTGIPCPFCGSTTVFMEAGAGHWTAALLANPVTVVAALVFFAAPLLAVDPVAVALRPSGRVRWIGFASVLVGSWLWQLHRYSLLG